MLRYSVNICPPCQNHSQKIQHVVKIKQENVQLKTEVVYWIVSEGLLITNVIPKVTRLTEELLKSKRQLGKAEDRRVLITIYETFWGGQALMTSIQAGRGSRGQEIWSQNVFPTKDWQGELNGRLTKIPNCLTLVFKVTPAKSKAVMPAPSSARPSRHSTGSPLRVNRTWIISPSCFVEWLDVLKYHEIVCLYL